MAVIQNGPPPGTRAHTNVCTAPSCSCNTKPVTPAAARAADEERWFDDVCEDIEEYLHWLGEFNVATRSEQEAIAAKVHAAKRAVIERFYQGVGR